MVTRRRLLLAALSQRIATNRLWPFAAAGISIGPRNARSAPSPGQGASRAGLAVTIDAGSTVLTFSDVEGIDVGDYIGEFVHQKCWMVVKGPWRVFFRPDSDGSRDEVVVEYGDSFAGPVAHITSGYTATIAKNGVEVDRVTVPQHWWLARWRWQSAPRPVVRTPDLLRQRKWIMNFGPQSLFGKPEPTTSLTWSGPMAYVKGINNVVGTAGDRDQIGFLSEAGAEYMIGRAPDVTLATIRVEGEWGGNACVHLRDTAGVPLNFATSDPALNYVGHRGKILNPANPSRGTYSNFVYPEVSHTYPAATAGWLLTEDPYFLEELMFMTNWAILQYKWSAMGKPGTSAAAGLYGVIPYGSARAYAWGLRDAFTLAATTPVAVPQWLAPKSYWSGILSTNLAYSMKYVNSPARVHALFRCWTQTNLMDGWMSAWLSAMVGYGVMLGFADWIPVFDWAIQQQIDMASGESGWDRRESTPYEWMVIKRAPPVAHSSLLTTDADAYTATGWVDAFEYWRTDPNGAIRNAAKSPVDTSSWDATALHYEQGISGLDTSYVGHHLAALTHAVNMGVTRAQGAHDYLREQFPVLLTSLKRVGHARFSIDEAAEAQAADPPPVNPLASLASGRLRALGVFHDGSAISLAHREYGSLVYDPNGRRMLMFGGGHSITYGPSDVIALPCSTYATPFYPLYKGTPAAGRNSSNVDADHWRYMSTNQHAAVHTFLAAVVWHDRYYLLSPGGKGLHAAAYLELNDMTWHWLDELTPAVTSIPWYYVASACIDPVSDNILVFAADRSWRAHWWVFDPRKNVITDGGPLPAFNTNSWVPDVIHHPPSDTFLCIQPSFTRGGTSQVHPAAVAEFKFDRTNYSRSTYSIIPTSGRLPPSVAAGGTPPSRWCYDATSNTFVGSVIDGKLYRLAYQPDGHRGSWSEQQMFYENGTPANGVEQYYTMLQYDPNSGCLIFVADTQYVTYAYRM